MFLMMITICSASFMKFGEFWKKMVKFHDIIKGRHCHHFSVKKFNFSEWAQISHACFWWWFQYVLQVWWNLVNSEKKLKFNDIIKGRHCRHFSVKKFKLWKGSNFTCMFLMMIPICSASLMKFGELWKNVEISWYYKGPALSAFFCEKI